MPRFPMQPIGTQKARKAAALHLNPKHARRWAVTLGSKAGPIGWNQQLDRRVEYLANLWRF